MNILFVGSGDITANYLADRLYREGHNISWATKEEKSLLLKKEFKGKIYREGYRTSVLNGILRLQGIDTVVFAYETYVGEDEEERESLIPALQNTLKALENHKIKHFVYLSTVELDYEQVLTPKLAEIEYGEKLCRSCQERKGLPLLILRMGMCFGRYWKFWRILHTWSYEILFLLCQIRCENNKKKSKIRYCKRIGSSASIRNGILVF